METEYSRFLNLMCILLATFSPQGRKTNPTGHNNE